MLNVMKDATKCEPAAPVVDLFRKESVGQADALRTFEQRERLGKLAETLSMLLDRLDIELKVDRERAIAMLAECTGLLDIAVQDISRIREVDETFGIGGRRVPRVAKLAEKLEKGLAYLLGIFSVVTAGENLSPYNWKLVERDVQIVLGISRAIGDELSPTALPAAA